MIRCSQVFFSSFVFCGVAALFFNFSNCSSSLTEVEQSVLSSSERPSSTTKDALSFSPSALFGCDFGDVVFDVDLVAFEDSLGEQKKEELIEKVNAFFVSVGLDVPPLTTQANESLFGGHSRVSGAFHIPDSYFTKQDPAEEISDTDESAERFPGKAPSLSTFMDQAFAIALKPSVLPEDGLAVLPSSYRADWQDLQPGDDSRGCTFFSSTTLISESDVNLQVCSGGYLLGHNLPLPHACEDFSRQSFRDFKDFSLSSKAIVRAAVNFSGGLGDKIHKKVLETLEAFVGGGEGALEKISGFLPMIFPSYTKDEGRAPQLGNIVGLLKNISRFDVAITSAEDKDGEQKLLVPLSLAFEDEASAKRMHLLMLDIQAFVSGPLYKVLVSEPLGFERIISQISIAREGVEVLLSISISLEELTQAYS